LERYRAERSGIATKPVGRLPSLEGIRALCPATTARGPKRDTMLLGHLALTIAALFTGAAVYINVAEQPARRSLSDGPMLAQWQASYPRAARMQASLALIGGGLGILTYFALGDWRWLPGAIALLAAWPYTLMAIKPTNDALHVTQASPEARRLIEKWGMLHAGRTGLGAAAVLLYLWALG
jgi:hypothetical protein